MNHLRPPGDGSPIEHQNHTRCRLVVIQLTSPVCIKTRTHYIWELTGETNARVENTTKDRSKLMMVEKTELFRASKVAKTLLSHTNMLGPNTVEPTKQLLDREGNVRASGDTDEKQACH